MLRIYVRFCFSLANVCDKSRSVTCVDRPNGFRFMKESVQCLRIGVDCLTVTGQMRYDRYKRVNFEMEGRKIFKLYRGTGILRRRQALEHRVIQSLGLF